MRKGNFVLIASFIRWPLALAVGVGVGGQTVSFEAGRVGVGLACFCGVACALGIWPQWREVAIWELFILSAILTLPVRENALQRILGLCYF